MNGADFLLQDQGTMAVLFSLTDEAVAWVDEHLPPNPIYWTGGVVVEHRYVAPIVAGILDDGLEVRA